jgi:hypothetical protein
MILRVFLVTMTCVMSWLVSFVPLYKKLAPGTRGKKGLLIVLTKLDVLTTGAYLGVAVGLGVLVGTGVFVAEGTVVAGAPTVTTDGVEMVAVVVGPAVWVTTVAEVVGTRADFGVGIPEHPAMSEATTHRQARQNRVCFMAFFSS